MESLQEYAYNLVLTLALSLTFNTGNVTKTIIGFAQFRDCYCWFCICRTYLYKTIGSSNINNFFKINIIGVNFASTLKSQRTSVYEQAFVLL